MSARAVELNSLITTFRELTTRLAALAEGLSDDPDTEASALAMFEAERSLRVALRALDRAERSLG